MKLRLLAGLGVLVLGSSGADAQTVNIEHQQVACAVAEKFPRLEARFAPADSVAAARVVFQGENRQEWYSVAMKAAGTAFAGVLPKPKKSLKAFRYYIEVTDKALGTNRTTEYTTNVIASAGECKGLPMAGSLGSASVVLQGPPGAAVLPAGFASNGVVAAGSSTGASGAAGAAGVAGATVAAGGGLSGAAVAGIVAGAGAAAVGVAVAAGSGGNSSSPGGSPMASPTPSSSSYTGPFSAQMVITFTPVGPGCQTTTSTHVGTLTMTLQQSSAGAVNRAIMTGTRTVIANTGLCVALGNVVGDMNPINWNGLQVTGSAANLVFSADGISFSGALNGSVITGTLTFTHMVTSPSGNQSGSATTGVTLR